MFAYIGEVTNGWTGRDEKEERGILLNQFDDPFFNLKQWICKECGGVISRSDPSPYHVVE